MDSSGRQVRGLILIILRLVMLFYGRGRRDCEEISYQMTDAGRIYSFPA